MRRSTLDLRFQLNLTLFKPMREKTYEERNKTKEEENDDDEEEEQQQQQQAPGQQLIRS